MKLRSVLHPHLLRRVGQTIVVLTRNGMIPMVRGVDPILEAVIAYTIRITVETLHQQHRIGDGLVVTHGLMHQIDDVLALAQLVMPHHHLIQSVLNHSNCLVQEMVR